MFKHKILEFFSVGNNVKKNMGAEESKPLGSEPRRSARNKPSSLSEKPMTKQIDHNMLKQLELTDEQHKQLYDKTCIALSPSFGCPGPSYSNLFPYQCQVEKRVMQDMSDYVINRQMSNDRPGYIIAYDMGLGKTKTAIAAAVSAIATLRKTWHLSGRGGPVPGDDQFQIVYIVPKSVVPTWDYEANQSCDELAKGPAGNYSYEIYPHSFFTNGTHQNQKNNQKYKVVRETTKEKDHLTLDPYWISEKFLVPSNEISKFDEQNQKKQMHFILVVDEAHRCTLTKTNTSWAESDDPLLQVVSAESIISGVPNRGAERLAEVDAGLQSYSAIDGNKLYTAVNHLAHMNDQYGVCHMVLLLTGTPIRTSPVALSSLMRIVNTGSIETIDKKWPVNESDFTKMYSTNLQSGYLNKLLVEMKGHVFYFMYNQCREAGELICPVKMPTIEASILPVEIEDFDKFEDNIKFILQSKNKSNKSKLIDPFYAVNRQMYNSNTNKAMKVANYIYDNYQQQKPFIVYTVYYKNGIELIEKALQHVWAKHNNPISNSSYGKFTGANVKTRHEDVNQFEAGKLQLDIILITEAGAVGLNLPSTKTVIIFEPSWAFADTLQALHRAVRVTSKLPSINVVHVLCVRKGEQDDLKLATEFMLNEFISDSQVIAAQCKIWKTKTFQKSNFRKNIELFIYARSIYRFLCVIQPYLTIIENASFPILPKKNDVNAQVKEQLTKQYIKAEEDQIKNETMIIKKSEARPEPDNEEEEKEEAKQDVNKEKNIITPQLKFTQQPHVQHVAITKEFLQNYESQFSKENSHNGDNNVSNIDITEEFLEYHENQFDPEKNPHYAEGAFDNNEIIDDVKTSWISYVWSNIFSTRNNKNNEAAQILSDSGKEVITEMKDKVQEQTKDDDANIKKRKEETNENNKIREESKRKRKKMKQHDDEQRRKQLEADIKKNMDDEFNRNIELLEEKRQRAITEQKIREQEWVKKQQEDKRLLEEEFIQLRIQQTEFEKIQNELNKSIEESEDEQNRKNKELKRLKQILLAAERDEKELSHPPVPTFPSTNEPVHPVEPVHPSDPVDQPLDKSVDQLPAEPVDQPIDESVPVSESELNHLRERIITAQERVDSVTNKNQQLNIDIQKSRLKNEQNQINLDRVTKYNRDLVIELDKVQRELMKTTSRRGDFADFQKEISAICDDGQKLTKDREKQYSDYLDSLFSDEQFLLEGLEHHQNDLIRKIQEKYESEDEQDQHEREKLHEKYIERLNQLQNKVSDDIHKMIAREQLKLQNLKHKQNDSLLKLAKEIDDGEWDIQIKERKRLASINREEKSALNTSHFNQIPGVQRRYDQEENYEKYKAREHLRERRYQEMQRLRIIQDKQQEEWNAKLEKSQQDIEKVHAQNDKILNALVHRYQQLTDALDVTAEEKMRAYNENLANVRKEYDQALEKMRKNQLKQLKDDQREHVIMTEKILDDVQNQMAKKMLALKHQQDLKQNQMHKYVKSQVKKIHQDMASLPKKQEYFQSDLLRQIENLREKKAMIRKKLKDLQQQLADDPYRTKDAEKTIHDLTHQLQRCQQKLENMVETHTHPVITQTEEKPAILLADKVSIKRKLQVKGVFNFLSDNLTFCDLGYDNPAEHFPGLVLSFIYYYSTEVKKDVQLTNGMTPIWNAHSDKNLASKIENWKISKTVVRILDRMNIEMNPMTSKKGMTLSEVQEFLQQWLLELHQQFGTSRSGIDKYHLHPLFVTRVLAFDRNTNRYILITPTCVADFSTRICTGKKMPQRMILAEIINKNNIQPAMVVFDRTEKKSTQSVFVTNRTYSSLVGYKV